VPYIQGELVIEDDIFMNKEYNIAVLIPCYNEALTIAKVITDFRRALPSAAIYVYDNNSVDATAKLAQEAGAIVRKESLQGKGNVIRSMFRDIRADCYLLVDGDDTYPVESAAELCRLVLMEGADMAVGDRLSTTYFHENKRLFHGFGNRLVRKIIDQLWGDATFRILDVMTGYRALSPLFVKSFPILSQGFEIETEMTIHALNHNLRIMSTPVSYRDRPSGSHSKLSTFSDGARVLLTIAGLYRAFRPLRLFGGVALAMALSSLGLFLPIFDTYLATGLVPRIPTLLVSSCLMLGAMLSLAVGMVLDAGVIESRRQYEMHLQTVAMLLDKNTNKDIHV
jgi:glycosyltransferase involved in cell wall biosynthesis